MLIAKSTTIKNLNELDSITKQNQTKEYHKFLKQEGSYDIRVPEDLLLKMAKDLRDNLMMDVLRRNRRWSFKDIGKIATDSEIETAIRNKASLPILRAIKRDMSYGTGYNFSQYKTVLEMKVSGIGDFRFIRTENFDHEQEVTEIQFREIDDENVRYLGCENFLPKDIPSALRFYHEPFVNLEEFMKYFEVMNLHQKEDDGHVWAESVKEMLIIDISICEKSEWFKDNMQVIKMIENHPELGNPELFRMQEGYHLLAMTHALEANE